MRVVVDDLGDEVELAGPPRRIVSLVPNLSELLAEWGLEAALIGVTDYCVEPPDGFATATRVRGTKNPDTAAIAAMAPDLVVANEEENRRLDVERLRRVGVPVYVTRVRTVRDVASCVGRLGGVIGREAAGAALRDDILRALREAGAAVGGAGLTGECVIWRDNDRHGDEETWWLVGGASYAGDLLTRSGLAPAVRTNDDRYPRVALARLLGADPGVVLLPDEPYAFTDDDARVFTTRGVRSLRVDGTELFWWGPRTPGAIAWLSRTARTSGPQPR